MQGIVIRMNDDRVERKLFDNKPKMIWLKTIEKDIRTMDIKRWRQRAEETGMG